MKNRTSNTISQTDCHREENAQHKKTCPQDYNDLVGQYIYIYIYIFNFYFLAAQPRIKSVLLALEVQSFKHWTFREAPSWAILTQNNAK